MDGLWARLLYHLVHQPHIGKSASGHDLIISSSSSIRVEVFGVNALASKVLGGRGGLGDVACGRDVVSSDRVSKERQHMSILDGFSGGDFFGGGLEERWVVDVGGVGIPLIEAASRGLEVVPPVSALGDLLINFFEHFGEDGLFSDISGLLSCGPDIFEEHVVALGILADGLTGEVDVHCPSQGVRHHQRRTR
eukprot:CAMPEP_0170550528 /NCGR_PEP_ID=MMETSP0211-20121228/8580_1 /TAXON_ID=311385 /ORGANISM="Pseudokeronopsis sp., Strain OXSARD2" /LENGTH=192 /DNA_ID=CAMNT_0010857133 /DNA_START=446 /DNA_END=1024 /DNA_ORIENTATION=+